MKYKRFLFLVFLVSIFSSFIFFIPFKNHAISGDATQYDAIAWNLASGHGYSLYEHSAYAPTNLREPGYIWILCIMYKLFGHSLPAVYVLQILLFSISAILVYFIANDIFSDEIGRYAAFLTAACPTLANYTIYLYSEAFFVFILLFSIYAIIKAKNTQLIRWYIIAGLMLGLLALSKAVMIFFIIPAMFYLWLNNRRDVRIILVFLIFSVIAGSWMARNYVIFGSFNLANRGEQVLLARAYKTEVSFRKIKETVIYSFSEYLGAEFFPKSGMRPRDFLFQEDYRVRREYQDLISQGMSQADISRLMRQKAIQIIKDHPVKYLIEMPAEFLRLMLFMYIPSLNETDTINRFKDFQSGPIFLSILRGVYKLSAFLILFLTILGIFRRGRIVEKEIIILALIIYINFIYSILGGYQRYAVPLIPFYFIYASAAFNNILKRRVG